MRRQVHIEGLCFVLLLFPAEAAHPDLNRQEMTRRVSRLRIAGLHTVLEGHLALLHVREPSELEVNGYHLCRSNGLLQQVLLRLPVLLYYLYFKCGNKL